MGKIKIQRINFNSIILKIYNCVKFEIYTNKVKK
jgi:hypothetical protein